jgi:hypothetical protein
VQGQERGDEESVSDSRRRRRGGLTDGRLDSGGMLPITAV